MRVEYEIIIKLIKHDENLYLSDYMSVVRITNGINKCLSSIFFYQKGWNNVPFHMASCIMNLLNNLHYIVDTYIVVDIYYFSFIL